MQNKVYIVNNKVANRIRFLVPMIKYRDTFADLLKQSLLRDPNGKGIYHAEPNATTGTILVKYHPAFHSEADIIELVRVNSQRIYEGKIEITHKHKNPKVGRMNPGAYFTRELIVSIVGNVIAGIILAVVIIS